MSEQKTAILILGMHRSGTSALTRVLNLCGVDLGTRLMPPAQDNNDSGFWEHVDAVDAHERLLFQFGRSWSDARALPDGWLESDAAAAAAQRIAALVTGEFADSRLWAVKDPRLCRFVPLWIKVLGEAGVRTKLVYALRHPDEVIASLVRRDGLSAHENGLLLLTHFFEAALAGAGQPRCVTTYQSLLDDWRGCVERIARELELELDLDSRAAEIEDFLDHGARNHHAQDDVAELRESLNGRIYALARRSRDSAEFWREAGELGDYWDLYRRDLLPYIDELLDMLAVRDSLERQGRPAGAGARNSHDRTLSPLVRLQFRMIAGLQDGIGRLGQASADLGAMVRIGSESALSATSEVAVGLAGLRENLLALPQLGAELREYKAGAQQQSDAVLGEVDALRRHMDELASGRDQRLSLFAADSERRLQEVTTQIQAAQAAEAASAAVLQQQVEALARRLDAAAERELQREQERQAARWWPRLRRLFSGK